MKKTLNLTTFSVERGITASTTQTQGYGGLTHDINEIAVCANSNDVVTMMRAIPGLKIVVANNGSQTLQVFPASGDNFVGSSANASTTINAGSAKHFISYSNASWIVFSN